MNYDEESIKLHKELQGKLSVKVDAKIETREDLSVVYTPGVAAVCKEIEKNPEKIYELSSVGKTIAVISNGTAVLGLGNIGARAGYPVMEGKAALFKSLGGVNTHPICIDITDIDKFIDFVKKISINYSGINLEDIKAPECFIIEKRLDEELAIPVFHDDQHGTAIVVYAGLKNALKIVGKEFSECKIVVSGAGSAGIAIAKLLLHEKPKELLLVDSKGILNNKRTFGPLEYDKKEISQNTVEDGNLKYAIKNADIFIGVSKPNLLTKEDVQTMAKDSIIFAMSNPSPEISVNEAKSGGAKIVANGRSDCINQVNNLLAFPGLFAGVIKTRKKITHEMKVKTAEVIASMIDKKSLSEGIILPNPLDKRVHKAVEEAISKM